MLILGNNRLSQVAVCLEAHAVFQLSQGDATAIAAAQIATIRHQWDRVCEEANLSIIDRQLFWRRQILNPFALEGAPESLKALLQ